ncbi:MAG: nitrate ABC transporter ATP-binding protein [Gammaproteobacteria bacterium CG_4_10_14_0_8_um_filter_38_16]|nr:MAG: nitrate ABC transporter ATP-binding protein [Gammaproteobacteria bacterium CG_4_10_14_0_8_um_filter_38_16]PJA03831.1 MAG: nitrate ABC transporter ATP-binding protein [Gammaproteobacteria bacterium CG_4_10_14_0_2_um_filter_38_22]PJB10805.1 MAG: nitrate ABC transporter ATP-binding protein [Gammaproteobacteria bacterium CG_4_9_14_3_um_filter_38_9]
MSQNFSPIMSVRNVKKSFKKKGAGELLVLDHVDFEVKENEIIAILGKSGSGKSTLLRILAGLVNATTGDVYFRDQKIHEPVDGLTMVFQHFALLPWLTVLENVELGLEAKGVSKVERRERALKAIDIVGLDGFESAYPKELSGGMSQRVGFARALVVDPEVLLMDEPFSALDVLTADNLRNDLIDIWQSGKTNIKSVILVTHNIEEAVKLADRIFVFANNPGYIRQVLPVTMLHPRNEQDATFREIVDEVYSLMTTPVGTHIPEKTTKFKTIDAAYRLPNVGVSKLTGFIETLASPEYVNKKVALPELAEELHFEIDDLFPIMEAMEILRFASVSEGDIELTVSGRSFADADILARKKMFSECLMQYVPIVRHIREYLDQETDHKALETVFIKELERSLSKQAAESVLTVVIDWGRYAEIFAYEYNTGVLSLENP